MNPEKQLRKAARRLRKASKSCYTHMGHTRGKLRWDSVALAPMSPNARYSYWVDAHAKDKTGTSYYEVCESPWGLDDVVYIALTQPKIGLVVADLLETYADMAKFGIGMSGDMKKAKYMPGSPYDHVFKLAKLINKGWKRRAKR